MLDGVGYGEVALDMIQLSMRRKAWICRWPEADIDWISVSEMNTSTSTSSVPKLLHNSKSGVTGTINIDSCTMKGKNTAQKFYIEALISSPL